MNSCDEEHTAAAMATDAMNKFSELLSALGALHAKEGSRHSETMMALGKNYSLEDDVTLIAQHWERLASEKHHLSKHKLTKSEKCRMTRLRTELSPELAARVLPKLVSRSEREVLLASVSLFTSRSALETRMRDRDLGKQPELEHVVMAASRRVGLLGHPSGPEALQYPPLLFCMNHRGVP